ncbi:ABC-type sugar transport system substrate-binding protein [Catenibacillus scindens]|uniref:ABC-type sugar transport system substrate-binding protein n=1 Tax=Catenibacillus scindens TaxID=673271 RepID=A0A7W8M4H4_9FIRM|nr:substrate-binding domain-containing protein [Catenibacillus scindens]MBB5264143.1 ABC-type sugar transport system substrate-binding protein [Catenibacillus scindens]
MKLKKLLALGTAAVLMASSLAACGADTSGGSGSDSQDTASAQSSGAASTDGAVQNETGAAGDSEDGGSGSGTGTFKIGYNILAQGSYALDTLAHNQEFVIEAFGSEVQAISDDGQVDKIVQDVENMIASGCDGLIIWLPADNLYQTVIDICTNAQVPFVFSDKLPMDESIKEQLMTNEYFAGAVGPANAEYGSLIAQYALDQGYTDCIISTGTQGDPTDTPRIEAFRETFEAGGGTIEQVVYSDNQDNIPIYVENALIAYPDVDFVYGTGSDYGIGACTAIENQGLDAKVLTSGLDSGALERLAAGGPLEFVNGDFWVSGTLSTVLLMNYLNGNPIKDGDGNPVWIDNIMPFEVSADQYADFQATFVDGDFYSADEIRAMNGITYDEFMNIVNSYSLEERLAAHQ